MTRVPKTVVLLTVLLTLSTATAALAKPRIRTTKNNVRFVRTPDARFANIKSFPYAPRYVYVSGFRMAYIDVGLPKKGTIILLHGEPDWGYLYRRMIPTFLRTGYRVIAPDMIGFGRSDKPVSRTTYTYKSHVRWMKTFMQILKLSNVDAFMQDWGGPIGLTIATEEPYLFNRIILANTLMPTGKTIPGFKEWVEFSQSVMPFDAADIIQSFINTRNLTENEKTAYRAPFPSELYLAGARQFPLLVPITPTATGTKESQVVRNKLRSWKKPVLLLWGLKDPLLGKTFYEDFKQLIPGTKGQPHQLFPEAHHFIQDDIGEKLARATVKWLLPRYTPRSNPKFNCRCR